jgi:hypothetical protein
VESEGGCEEREETELHHAVVENLVLGDVVGDIIAVLELPADSTIPGGNGHTSCQGLAGLEHNGGANPGHGSVNQRGSRWADVLVGLDVDAGVLCQHVDVGDLDLVEEEETVIHSVVTLIASLALVLPFLGLRAVTYEFWSNISDVNTVEGLVSLQVSDLDNEGVWSKGLSVEDKLRHNHGVVGGAAQRANPPFRGSEMGGVNDEGLVGGVPGGGSLKTTNVGAVSQLGLGVATNVLVVLCWLKEELVLFGSSLVSEGSLDRLVNALPIPVPLLGNIPRT